MKAASCCCICASCCCICASCCCCCAICRSLSLSVEVVEDCFAGGVAASVVSIGCVASSWSCAVVVSCVSSFTSALIDVSADAGAADAEDEDADVAGGFSAGCGSLGLHLGAGVLERLNPLLDPLAGLEDSWRGPRLSPLWWARTATLA